MISKRLCAMIAILFLFSSLTICYAHPGKTDSNGGHWNRKTGTYHDHNDGSDQHSLGGESGNYSYYNDFVSPRVYVSVQNKRSVLAAGEQFDLNVAGASDYTARSSNDDIIRVTDGRVFAINPGTATITISAANGAETSFNITVPVVKLQSINGINDFSINCGESQGLHPTLELQNTTQKHLKYQVSDINILTVDANGIIKTNSPGTCNIKIIGENDISTECTVTVKEVFPTSIDIDKDDFKLEINTATRLFATIAPSNVTNQAIVWKSHAPAILTIEADGNVTPVNEGVASVTVCAANGKVDTVRITVFQIHAESIEIQTQENIAKVGNTLFVQRQTPLVLTPVVYPANVTYSIVTWTEKKQKISFSEEQQQLLNFQTGGLYSIAVRTADDISTVIRVFVWDSWMSWSVFIVFATVCGVVYYKAKKKKQACEKK
ncbi:MAG: Ig-like domain-containing protein [Ruthenibacterium sp.]